jgi:mRNA-degrading endonuclease RelE of RelBE toxin-antitoxin system
MAAMTSRSAQLDGAARKACRRLPRHVVLGALRFAAHWVQDGPAALACFDVRKVASRPGVARLRLGAYRALFHIDGATLVISEIGPKSQMGHARVVA